MTLILKEYPKECTTDAQKLEFVYRVQEKLRLLHNLAGEKYRNSELTKEQWDIFLKEWQPKYDAMIEEILKYKNIARTTLKYESSISLNDMFKEE
jgi:hypothetical protein